MTELDEFRRFILRQRDLEDADQRIEGLLTADALVDRGLAVSGLSVVSHPGQDVVLQCEVNESRLRPGTQVLAECGSRSVSGRIQGITDAGRTIALDVRHKGQLPAGPWLLREAPINLTPIFLECLQKFQAGAPGWTVLRVLTGQHQDIPRLLRPADAERARAVVEEVCRALPEPLDPSQRDSLACCLEQPLIMGVQGPPGTGKTKVLAAVAEALARLGKRVLIVAPTHQAVNNALTTLHRLFPARRVVKIGDRLHRESLAPDVPYMLLREVGRELPAEVVRETVLGMTVVSALCQFALRSSGLAPNVILVDEAGQLPLVEGVCLGLLGAGPLLLFGDDAQMPPVFPAEVGDDPVAVSIFERLRAVQPGAVKTLNTTYRLNRDLCEVVARCFYGDPNAVRPAAGARDRRFRLNGHEATPSSCVAAALYCDRGLIWVEVEGGDSRQENHAEATAVADAVSICLGAGLEPNDLAVVTPYRRQAALIRRLLQSCLEPTELPIVDTVERVQGLTVELVLVSFCTADPEYAAVVGRFLFSPNRLNVAISRARTKAILFGSQSLFSTIPLGYQDMLNQLRTKAVFQQAALIAPQLPTTD